MKTLREHSAAGYVALGDDKQVADDLPGVIESITARCLRETLEKGDPLWHTIKVDIDQYEVANYAATVQDAVVVQVSIEYVTERS